MGLYTYRGSSLSREPTADDSLSSIVVGHSRLVVQTIAELRYAQYRVLEDPAEWNSSRPGGRYPNLACSGTEPGGRLQYFNTSYTLNH